MTDNEQHFLGLKKELINIYAQIKQLETDIMIAPRHEIKRSFDTLDVLVQQDISTRDR